MKNLWLIVVASSFFAITGVTRAQAQVVDTIVADIPFGFNVSDTTLPAGKYTIQRLNSAEPGVMVIRSADGVERRMFLVGSAQSFKLPDESRLIFDRVGDQYFLTEIFEVGSNYGVELNKSRSERQLEKERRIAQLDSVAVPAHTGITATR